MVKKLTITLAFLLHAVAMHAQTVKAIGVHRVTLGEGRNYIALPTLPATNTLAHVLGTNLPAASVESSATVLDLWDQSNQTLTNRYWLSFDTNFPGWRASSSFADANGVLLDANKGMIVTIRAGTGSQTLYFVGYVPGTNQTQIVQNNGYTLAASNFPLPVSLANSSLIVSGFVGGNSLVTSDNVLFFNPATQQFDVKVWYDTGSAAWRNSDATVATKTLDPGESFLIKRRNRSGNFTWTNQPPYSVSGVYQ
ncbi:MAG: hypothetical protein EXS18_01840 [Verrucomicrobiae bacterium]|nr:hypothetical protein [Verrucomicrobiae bacterium]